MSRLEAATGMTGQEPIFALISPAVRIEALTWLAKVRSAKGTFDAGIANVKTESEFIAWAHVGQELVEKRDVSLVIALRDLHALVKEVQ
jgi:hypothetical protein